MCVQHHHAHVLKKEGGLIVEGVLWIHVLRGRDSGVQVY